MSSFVFLVSFSYAATVTGTVKGPDGAPFEGAFVQAQNIKSKITVSVLSNMEGHYRVEKLPEGEYQLRIRAIGYKADPRTGVNLKTEQNASFDFALQKGMVRWSEEVVNPSHGRAERRPCARFDAAFAGGARAGGFTKLGGSSWKII